MDLHRVGVDPGARELQYYVLSVHSCSYVGERRLEAEIDTPTTLQSGSTASAALLSTSSERIGEYSKVMEQGVPSGTPPTRL